MTQEPAVSIIYTGYPDNKKDKIGWNKNVFHIRSKLDPGSIKIYHVFTDFKQYIVFTGKSQSASGSGVQVTYFVLCELDKNEVLTIKHEFESRFGNINNIFDFNRDGVLDYFKIKNGRKEGEYLLTINSTLNDESIVNGYMLLMYRLNDKFTIIEDYLTDKNENT